MQRLDPDRDGEDDREVVQSFDPDLVEYVVITFPDVGSVAGIASTLDQLVSGAQIRILDLVVICTGADGRARAVQPGTAPELAPLEDVEGEVGGLLGEDDIALAADALPPRSTALVLVLEDMWAEQLAEAVRSARGRIVGGERIPRRRLQGLHPRATREDIR
jgi:uncharacterized membrane protein